MKLKAKWTPDQVRALNAFQHRGMFHPFTCGNDSRHRVLLATEDGWVCEDCDYTQDWAHDFMTKELTRADDAVRRTTAHDHEPTTRD